MRISDWSSDVCSSDLATSPKKRLIGLLAFGDEAKTSAEEAIEILHRRGVRSIMLTGDNAGSANAVAKQLGIDEVIANVLPEGKADAVASLRGEDRTVAMVGDGVNDAPALAAADRKSTRLNSSH